MNAASNSMIAERQALVMNYYGTVRAIASRIHRRLPRSVDVEELVSAGVTGLIEAIDRYDDSHSVPFEAYARYRVQGAILDSLREADWVPRSVRRKSDNIDRTRRYLEFKTGKTPTREEMARALDVSVDKYDAMVSDSEIRPVLSLDAPVGEEGDTRLVDQVGSDPGILDDQIHEERRQLVVDAVQNLPERERTAIGLYYFHELSLKEVGEVLGVSESRACQLCGQGIKRLRKRLREHI